MLADTKLLRRCMPFERLVQRPVLNAEGMFQWAERRDQVRRKWLSNEIVCRLRPHERIKRFYAKHLPLSREMAKNLQSFGEG